MNKKFFTIKILVVLISILLSFYVMSVQLQIAQHNKDNYYKHEYIKYATIWDNCHANYNETQQQIACLKYYTHGGFFEYYLYNRTEYANRNIDWTFNSDDSANLTIFSIFGSIIVLEVIIFFNKNILVK